MLHALIVKVGYKQAAKAAGVTLDPAHGHSNGQLFIEEVGAMPNTASLEVTP
jgi:hypothetical protein